MYILTRSNLSSQYDFMTILPNCIHQFSSEIEHQFCLMVRFPIAAASPHFICCLQLKLNVTATILQFNQLIELTRL